MKNKLIYRILVGLTFVLPISIYLIVMAASFKIYSHASFGVNHNEVTVVERFENEYILLDENVETFNGKFTTINGEQLVLIHDETIYQFNDGYFVFENGAWSEYTVAEIKEAQGWKIPTAVAISLVGIVLVVLVISKKMRFHVKFPRAATLLALIFGTIILGVINLIVGNLLEVFMITTFTWAAYMIEYAIYNGFLTEQQGKKVKNELDGRLDDALEGLK